MARSGTSGTITFPSGLIVPVRHVTTMATEGASRPIRSWEETIYQSQANPRRLFLVRDSWRGRIWDGKRARHHVNVRRISAVGALLWILSRTALPGTAIERPLTKKIARQFWASLKLEVAP